MSEPTLVSVLLDQIAFLKHQLVQTHDREREMRKELLMVLKPGAGAAVAYQRAVEQARKEVRAPVERSVEAEDVPPWIQSLHGEGLIAPPPLPEDEEAAILQAAEEREADMMRQVEEAQTT